jgi:hypothetical protein
MEKSCLSQSQIQALPITPPKQNLKRSQTAMRIPEQQKNQQEQEQGQEQEQNLAAKIPTQIILRRHNLRCHGSTSMLDYNLKAPFTNDPKRTAAQTNKRMRFAS